MKIDNFNSETLEASLTVLILQFTPLTGRFSDTLPRKEETKVREKEDKKKKEEIDEKRRKRLAIGHKINAYISRSIGQ